jgi:hypothetical protein
MHVHQNANDDIIITIPWEDASHPREARMICEALLDKLSPEHRTLLVTHARRLELVQRAMFGD